MAVLVETPGHIRRTLVPPSAAPHGCLCLLQIETLLGGESPRVGSMGVFLGSMCLVDVSTGKGPQEHVHGCVDVCTVTLVYPKVPDACLWGDVMGVYFELGHAFGVEMCVYDYICICRCESVFNKRKEPPHVQCATFAGMRCGNESDRLNFLYDPGPVSTRAQTTSYAQSASSVQSWSQMH